MQETHREARWRQIKDVAAMISLCCCGSGALAVLYWHYSGWWLILALL